MVHARSAVPAAPPILVHAMLLDRKGRERQRQHGWRSFRRHMIRGGFFSPGTTLLAVGVRSGGTDRPPPSRRA